MKMRGCLYALLTAPYMLFLSGCTYNIAPKNNQGFRENITLSDLEGVYRNRGEPSGYLTNVLWGIDLARIDPQSKYSIDKVEVVAQDKTVVVKAVKGDCSVFEKRYVYGKDFTIDNGKIEVRRDAAFLTRGGDDPLLGPSSEKVVLGIDASGHGKSHSEAFAAGLVYMLFPVAVSSTTDIRFEKLSATPQYYIPCRK